MEYNKSLSCSALSHLSLIVFPPPPPPLPFPLLLKTQRSAAQLEAAKAESPRRSEAQRTGQLAVIQLESVERVGAVEQHVLLRVHRLQLLQSGLATADALRRPKGKK